MLLKEKTTGSVQYETIVCRSRLDQVILLMIAVSLIFYTWFEYEISTTPMLVEFRFWVGIILLSIAGISFIDTRLKQLMLGTMNKIPFIVIPAMLTNLFYKNLEPYYTMYFLTMYASMSFLITNKEGLKAYIMIMSLGVAWVLWSVPDSLMHELSIMFAFININVLIWVVGREFLWNYKRLGDELNIVNRLSYLNSHKLRARVARIIGLNNLIELGDGKARGLLKGEIESVEEELQNMQVVISQPIEKDGGQENKLTARLTPLEFTLIGAELIFLANVYIFR